MNRTVIGDAADFGHAVRLARKEAGLSQMQLAAMCGCSQRFVSQVERGKPTAELGKALTLLSALGTPLAAGQGIAIGDGRAEVRHTVVRIADTVGEKAPKRRKLASYLEDDYQ